MSKDKESRHAVETMSSTVNTADKASPSNAGWWLLLAGVVVAIDQWTKRTVVEHLFYGEEVNALPFFSWVYWRNPGSAFSFLNDAGGWQRWFFIALAVGFCGYLIYELRRLRRDETLQALAFALILGGAIGNMIDRALLGYVIDFLKFHWGERYFPAFNVADSAIFLGAVFWFTLIWREGAQARAAENILDKKGK